MADERPDSESILMTDLFSQWERKTMGRRRRIELADLVNQPWVLPPPESSFASVAMEAFRNSGLDFRVRPCSPFPLRHVSA